MLCILIKSVKKLVIFAILYCWRVYSRIFYSSRELLKDKKEKKGLIYLSFFCPWKKWQECCPQSIFPPDGNIFPLECNIFSQIDVDQGIFPGLNIEGQYIFDKCGCLNVYAILDPVAKPFRWFSSPFFTWIHNGLDIVKNCQMFREVTPLFLPKWEYFENKTQIL